ncbi:MAG TPA: tRNA (adenosine(37)-N6)-threonylcarbamoyltransferase complex dimerization subunit type 1 TsaB [Ktedonobacterales bacterium]|nr:tRNA (adenosine(37)-N6)-threonylcarbamoyltransferase complex dimerization subunit type 1 TsaB [Ktedonobacterales bacterium]
MLLTLDTSTAVASLALLRGATVVVDETWDVGRRQSQELIAHLDALMARAGAGVADLTAVAVALGPGSFNGVRVGVTTAKTLALALGVPLYGACTLDVIAAGVAPGDGAICALLEAGRGEVYRAFYRRHGAAAGQPVTGDLTRISEYGIVALPALVDEIAGSAVGVVCAGEWQPATRAALEAALGPRARFAQPAASRGALLGGVAAERARRGERDEPATMEPVYLRRPNITQPAPRRAGGLGAVRSEPERSRDHEGDARALRH